MLLIILVVFLAVFALFVLVTMAAGGRSKQTEAVRAKLESVLLRATGSGGEEVVDLRKNTALSSIRWLDRLLARMRPAADLRRFLAQADVKWTPGRLLLTALAAWMTAGYAIHLRIGAAALSALIGLLGAAVPFVYVGTKRQKRFNKFLKVLPDSIDLMVSALRAGNSTMGALGILASQAPEPVRGEFRICFDEQSYGMDMRAAMENLLARVPLPDLRIIATAILIQKESGGNLAEILEKTAQIIRDRFRVYEQIRIHTAQGRITGWILSLFPVALAIFLSVTTPKYLEVLFTRPLGHKMIGAAIILNLIGVFIMRKIIRIEV